MSKLTFCYLHHNSSTPGYVFQFCSTTFHTCGVKRCLKAFHTPPPLVPLYLANSKQCSILHLFLYSFWKLLPGIFTPASASLFRYTQRIHLSVENAIFRNLMQLHFDLKLYNRLLVFFIYEAEIILFFCVQRDILYMLQGKKQKFPKRNH
jgi:hypothetical protein